MNNTPDALEGEQLTWERSMAGPLGRTCRRALVLVLGLVAVFAPLANAERTKLKPGLNFFSPQQDVELGQKVSRDAERQLPMLNDRRVDGYLNSLGRRLAGRAPGEHYPYQFKGVNDGSINAFALPGGFLYVNRGTIEVADNEAQLAGVMGHEIGHVALRHGTNQASKAYLWQMPLAAAGGVLGSDSVAGVLTQLGASFAVNSVLLKYSRDAERQADIVGTQILYDNNYDPRAMAQFFEKIEAEGKRGRPPQWLSSHPNPENRMQNVLREVDRLGGLPANYRTDSPEFQDIKRYVRSLPPAPKAGSQQHQRRDEQGRLDKPARPSDRFQAYDSDLLRVRHPDNWRPYGGKASTTLAPDGGIVGNEMLAYGVIISLFEPRQDRHVSSTLESATDQLIDQLMGSNPNMRVQKDHQRARTGGQPALSTLLTNESPLGGREYDWLVTVLRPEGLIYFVCVAPEGDYSEYSRYFERVIDSASFTSR